MVIGSLFSGAGLGDLGFEWAGFDHAWFCEIDDYARQVLALRWPGKTVHHDIQELKASDLTPVDVLAGGFPCQDVSQAGDEKGIVGGKRSGLWFHFARLIAETSPRWVVIENVERLRHRGRGFGIVLQHLAEIGYDAEWEVLHSSDLGGHQARKRLYIVAYPCGLGTERFFQAQHINQMRQRWASSKTSLLNVAAEPYRGHTGWPQPLIRRGIDEYSCWLDRLRCVGNGIDPRCTYYIGSRIKELTN